MRSLDEFAQNHGFSDWSELEFRFEQSGTLLTNHTVSFTRLLNTNRSTAWSYLADDKNIATWMFPAEFEAVGGAPFSFAPEGWHGTIGVLEKEKELRFDAVAEGWTWFRLDEFEGKTRLRLWDYLPPDFVVPNDVLRDGALSEVQPGGEGTHWQGVLAGWHTGLDTLADSFSMKRRTLDYESLDRLYKMLIQDYHRVD